MSQGKKVQSIKEENSNTRERQYTEIRVRKASNTDTNEKRARMQGGRVRLPLVSNSSLLGEDEDEDETDPEDWRLEGLAPSGSPKVNGLCLSPWRARL